MIIIKPCLLGVYRFLCIFGLLCFACMYLICDVIWLKLQLEMLTLHDFANLVVLFIEKKQQFCDPLLMMTIERREKKQQKNGFI